MSNTLTANQQAWVDALRSGQYKQTKYRLQDESGYCCLGVACRIADKAGVPTDKRDDGTILGGSLIYQPDVKAWLGLIDDSGAYITKDGDGRLTVLNDCLGKTFSEIADIIEANAGSLFND